MKTDPFFTQIRNMVKRVSDANVALSAAGLAYYTLFSVFPLLLLLISISSALFKAGGLSSRILWFIEQAIPGSQGLMLENQPILGEERNAIGLAGLVTLFWSASNVFMVLDANINIAWPGSRRRNYFRRRLIALGIVGILVVVLIVYIFFILLFQFLIWLRVPLLENLNFLETSTWSWVSKLIAWLLIFSLLYAIYRWVPATIVPRRSALIGALVATLILFAINWLFTLVSSFMIQRYQLIYGSLSSVLAFLVNIYFSSFVVLLGAHFSAVISEVQSN